MLGLRYYTAPVQEEFMASPNRGDVNNPGTKPRSGHRHLPGAPSILSEERPSAIQTRTGGRGP